MAEIYAQTLEANGYTVDRAGIGLGQRPVVAPAIESGQIDLQPEYIGSRLSYELKASPNPSVQNSGPDSAANLTNLQTMLTPKSMTAAAMSRQMRVPLAMRARSRVMRERGAARKRFQMPRERSRSRFMAASTA